MTAWVCLILAGLLEVAWAIFLKASDGFTRAIPATIAIAVAAASLYLLSLSMRTLTASVAYPVWVGIGMAGISAYGMVFVGEPRNPSKFIYLLVITAGVTGLAVSER